MKKFLLGATALASLIAGAASAQQVTTKQPFTVTLNGDVRFYTAWADDDRIANEGLESSMDYRVILTAAAKADNGLEYGFVVRFRNNQEGVNAGSAQDTVGADNKFLYLQGGWGRLNLGDYRGAMGELEVFKPDAGFLHNANMWGSSNRIANIGSYFSDSFATSDQNRVGGTKLTYLTPNFSGFRAGVSYVPEYDERGRDLTRTTTAGAATPRYNDQWEIAANYTANLSGVGVKLNAGYSWADNNTAASTLGDFSVWNVGANVSYAGFTFGGVYWDNNGTSMAKLSSTGATASNGQEQDVWGWGLGLTYEAGPWVVGTTYASVHRDLPIRNLSDVDTSLWTIGATYKVAPGLIIQGDVGFFDTDDYTSTTGGGTRFSNDGTIVAARTRLQF